MPNKKESCRGCGTLLSPKAICNDCEESVLRIYSKGGKIEDVTHVLAL
jgi:hypothetical protein